MNDKPAVAGGPPAKTVPYGRAERYGEPELVQLRHVLEQGTLFYAQGRKVKELEAACARRLGVASAIACSSGTAAIHSALIALGISPGDEVITAPITDMGSVIPILYQGAVPVFADLDRATANLLPEAVEAAITPNTRAVLAVHLAGNCCDLAALGSICRSRGIALVEDCAQCFGATYRGRPAGTLGDAGCFSLNEFKQISCGDGGLVVSDDGVDGAQLRMATDKAYDRRPDATMRDPRFLAANYRMTELQGAVALAQLDRLDSIVERRRQWCGALRSRISGLPGLKPPGITEGCDPSWWFFVMQVNPGKLGADAGAFASALQAEGLPASAHYIGRCLYEYPVFAEHSAFARGLHAYQSRSYRRGDCPNAERVLDRCVILAINEGYTEQDLEETTAGIVRVARWMARER